jgi:hypothetical protein
MTALGTDDGKSGDHWVPQFYLRRWITGPEKKLSAFWSESSRERHARCSPRAVLSENHLYSVYNIDGEFIHGESLIFQEIDNAAAPAFEYLADGNWRELPDHIGPPLYRFIYTLEPRSRHMRERFIQGDERSQSEQIGTFRKMGFQDAEERVHQFWSMFASPRDRAAFQMLAIARFSDSWQRFFDNIPLYVYDIGDVDAEFFTSDAPLHSNPSVDAEDAIHIFPLSPKRCMVASHDPANLSKLCGMSPLLFVSVINLQTLSRANTAIARDRRYEREIFKFLGASVNPNYCSNAVEAIFQEKLRIGVGPEVKIIYGSESEDEILLYKTSREAFAAGIQGCAWLSSEPSQSRRPIGPCEQLILSTRDWYLDASSRRDAYEIGCGLSYLFFQLDKWNQPIEIALELRKRLWAHSVRFVHETRHKGENIPYGLNEVLSEFSRIAAEALKQIYYDPSNHSREVWQYVNQCSTLTNSPRRSGVHILGIVPLRIRQVWASAVQKLGEVWWGGRHHEIP